MLQEVAKKMGNEVVKKCTAAGLVGSIDEGRSVISPVWDNRNKIITIDEFNTQGGSADETKQAILDIIEKGEYSKRTYSSR